MRNLFRCLSMDRKRRLSRCVSFENTENNKHHQVMTFLFLYFKFYYNKIDLYRKRMICGNSFDQKFGELHDSSWNNSRFDVIKLTDELRELDGRIIDCIYKDNQWVFQRLRHDRKSPNNRKAVESNNKQLFLNVSITLNYLSLIDLFT